MVAPGETEPILMISPDTVRYALKTTGFGQAATDYIG